MAVQEEQIKSAREFGEEAVHTDTCGRPSKAVEITTEWRMLSSDNSHCV